MSQPTAGPRPYGRGWKNRHTNDPGSANDGSVHPVNTPCDEPFSLQICELFKIRDGKLLQIEALVTPAPYGMPTGWGGKASIKE